MEGWRVVGVYLRRIESVLGVDSSEVAVAGALVTQVNLDAKTGITWYICMLQPV